MRGNIFKLLVFVFLAGICLVNAELGVKTKIVHVEAEPDISGTGIWKKKISWTPRWVKSWVPKQVYVAVWKKVYSPVISKEFVPKPVPPPVFLPPVPVHHILHHR